jgi:hypothetical protein
LQRSEDMAGSGKHGEAVTGKNIGAAHPAGIAHRM